MKKLIFVFTLFLSLNVFASEIEPDIQTILNPPKANEIFVPPGFDDLDEAELTFVNYSKTSCYLKTYFLPPQIDHEKKTIKISNMSMILKSDFCKFRSIPTPSTVKLGELKEGAYQIEFETSKNLFESLGTINIAKSKSSEKDDFEYAALDVNELTVKVNKETKNIELNLPGNFPNGCYAFKEVKVIDNRSDSVVEVLPIVEMVTTICTQAIQFYNKTVSIPYSVVGPTKKLIHIRSADGVAINRIVNLE